MASLSIDVSGFEKWLASVPQSFQVTDWKVNGLDVWPLFNTCLVSLAILTRIQHRKAFMKVGSPGWRAGVVVDYAVAAPIRWIHGAWAWASLSLPPDRLEGCVVYCGSKVHTRELGEVIVTAPLEVPATLMRRAGHEGVFWFEGMTSADPRLDRCLNLPARGVDEILRVARIRAWRISVARDLDRLSGFLPWCDDAARILSLSPAFMRIWLARQLEVALSTARCFGEVFDAKGCPKLLVLLNGGFASTVGLTVAAKTRGVAVVEVQHGADSAAFVTAPDVQPHFSGYNSAPDAMISWEMTSRADPAVLAMGPIGLHLPRVVVAPHHSDDANHRALRNIFERQQQALSAFAHNAQARHEVLVSLQPGDQGQWLEAIARKVGPGVLYWVRRHGSDLSSEVVMRGLAGSGIFEIDLASSSALPELLARASVHLTRFSAVALEAAACGIPTIAVEAYARQLYERSIPATLLFVEPDLASAAHKLTVALSEARAGTRAQLPNVDLIVPFLEARMKR